MHHSAMEGKTRIIAIGGVALIAGVVALRLGSGSYERDLRKVCFAEKNAGLDAKIELAAVEKWAKEQLDTPEASAWFAGLLSKGIGDRGEALRQESSKVGIASCPLVGAYDELRARAEYRRDLFTLCSDLANVDDLDDAKRLDKIREWISTFAKSPRILPLGDKLANTDAKDRADILRAVAKDATVYQCGLAGALDKPQTVRADKPRVRFGSPQINGDLRAEVLAASLVANVDAMQKCYESGLAKKADLAGRILMRIAIVPGGKVSKTSIESGTTLPDQEVITCIANAVRAMQLPSTKAPLNVVMLPLDLTPSTPVAVEPRAVP